MAKPWKLYYDGGCNLCHESKLRVERWAEKRGMPLEVDILQSQEAVEKGYGQAMVLETEERVYTGFDAWLFLLRLAPWYFRWIAPLGRFPLTAWFVRWVYGMVAKYRYKWFGTRSCQIPAKK